MTASMLASAFRPALLGALMAFSLPLGAAEVPDLTGGELYADFCAACHGAKGHGDGPVASSLKRKVPDLTRLAQRRGGVFPAEEVHQIIDGRRTRSAHGSSVMPVWGSQFYGYEGEDATRRQRVAELIDHIIAYLRSIQTMQQ